MDEQRIRDIIKEELAKNYNSGSPDVPPHVHNGTDNLRVQPQDLQGFGVLPTTKNGVLNPVRLKGTFLYGNNSDKGGVFTCPIPILVNEGPDGFAEGDAPTGAMLVFDQLTMTNPILWIKVGNDDYNGRQWAGVELIL